MDGIDFTDDGACATLDALIALVLDGAPHAPAGAALRLFRVGLAPRIDRLPPDRRAAFGLAIRVLGSRAGALVASGRPVPLLARDAAARARLFAAFGTSPIPALRSAHQAVRRLVLAVHYGNPLVARAVGHPIERPEAPRPSAARPVPHGVVLGTDRPGDTHITADVVVIGSGAGGAVTAARLAEAGFETVVLESGAYWRPEDFTEEEAALTERLYEDGGARTTDDLSVAVLQGRSVGGSTTVNWMLMLRTPEWTLDEWARDHGAYGMSAGEMRPVFEEIERVTGTSPVGADAHSANNTLLLDGARRLGWRAQGASINAIGCIGCGNCGIGCRHDAKQSMTLTFLPRALRAGARLFADTTVHRIEPRERDTGAASGTAPPLKRVHATRWTGTRSWALTVDAPIVVLAAGAVGTPVLLQRSGMGGGGVGDWLRLHPTTGVFGVYDREIRTSTGIPMSTLCDEFVRWDGTDHGFWIECPPLLPSFAAAALTGFGPEHAARVRQFHHLGVLIALTRDGADRGRSSGRVRAGNHGAVSIRYRLSREDAERVRASMAAAARIHLAAGAREVATLHTPSRTVRTEADAADLATSPVAPNRLALFSAHACGTCRMGLDPAVSGATPDGERHGVRGLYITDGALLPTAPGVNPQETIMATAHVLAGRMIARHRATQG